MALKISSQAQDQVAKETGTYYEIDNIIEDGIKPDGDQAHIAYKVMDVLKGA